jgi:hypothetical protein
MPFKSEKQRKYMWAKMPDLARKWADEEKRTPEDEQAARKKKSRLARREAIRRMASE